MRSKDAWFAAGCVALTSFFLWVGTTATTTRLPTEASPPEFYSNHCRDDLQMTFAKAIDRAEESVHLAIYTLTDKRILRSLNSSAERGRSVTVLYDGRHSYGLSRKLDERIKKLKATPSGLMHQKILVIDGKEVWIGSANMTYPSLKMHGNLVIAFESPMLAKTLIGSITSKNARAPPERNFIVGDQSIEYWQLPKERGALARLITLLDTAKKTVRVAMFTWTHPQLTDAVIAAHERGLTVEAIVDRTSGSGASKNVVSRLNEAGVPTRLSEGSALLHHKLAWIDGTTLVCGSANWTKAAFTRNEDCFLILHDLDDDQQRYLSKMWRVLRLESQPCQT